MSSKNRLMDMLGLEKKRLGIKLLEQAKVEFLHRHLRPEAPIQSQAIYPIYRGKDAILVSATASGKTEAAMIPISANLLSQHRQALAIYIAPTQSVTK